MVEAAIARLFLPEFDRVAARLDAELDNVRAALAWLDEAGEPEAGLRLAAAMFLHWMVRDAYREGRRHLERALERADRAPTPARAMALTGAGWLAHLQGDREAAAPLLTEGLAVARAAGDREVEAVALAFLGFVEQEQGDDERATRGMEAALALHLELEAAPGAGRGQPWTPGMPTQVTALCANLAQVALARNDLAAAERYLAEARRRRQALGRGWLQSSIARCQGDLALAHGDQEGALAAYRESLEVARDRGERRFLAEAIAGIAGVDVARGQPERAARLLAAAAALREQLGAPQGWGRPVHESAAAAARAALPPEAFAAAWAAGTALPLEEAITEALQAADPAGVATPAPTAPDLAVAAGLTAREAEVLRLLAQGSERPRDRRVPLAQPAHDQRPRHPPADQTGPRVAHRRRHLRRPPRPRLSPHRRIAQNCWFRCSAFTAKSGSSVLARAPAGSGIMVHVQVPDTQHPGRSTRRSQRLGDAHTEERAARCLPTTGAARAAETRHGRYERPPAPTAARKDGERMNTRRVDPAPGLLGRRAHAPHRPRSPGRRRRRACHHRAAPHRPCSRARKHKETTMNQSTPSTDPRPSSWCTAASPTPPRAGAASSIGCRARG